MTTVLIVDDHAAFRSAARVLLESEGFEVVGEAENGAAAVEATAVLKPDLVLLDVQLPDLDGVEVAKRLVQLPKPPAIVLTSTRRAADYGSRLEEAPVRGFVSKDDLSGIRIARLVRDGAS